MQLAADQARARLADVPVAHLATADQAGQPHIVAITFVVDGDSILTAVDRKPKQTRKLKRLRNIQANPRVSILADHYEEDWTKLWWARADGTAAIVDSQGAMERPLDRLQEKYRQYEDNRPDGPVIAVTVERWNGWAYSG